MKTNPIKCFWRAIPSFCLVLSAGCVTVDETELTQIRQDILRVQEDMRKLSGRIEGVELENQQARSELDNVRAGLSRNNQSQSQAFQSGIEDLNRRISALEAGRERDKQEIIDRLTKKIAEIIKASSGPTARPAPPSGGKKPAATSGYGYEHEVKAGETISAIAAAYGVKPSVILEANNIQDATKIRVGQKLFVPEK